MGFSPKVSSWALAQRFVIGLQPNRHTIRDAHRHFFPLSNYQFRRPISYWDVKRHGAIVALVELLVVLAATLYIFPRTQSLTGQGLLAIINIIYATGYFCFYLRERVPVGRARSRKKPSFFKKPGFGNN
ncbi:hypothetical protein [Kamptonema formosum]|uniref:hypothetical protein n=1 Tax=Kamptonema formosum TaxID=331992 RepID=UPI0003699F87|nr:hypothetical protein [Oscillatoria sp. PCC 10802]